MRAALRGAVWFGRDVFGTPCVLACYASTLRAGAGLWVPILVSLGMVVGVHACWLLLHSPHPAWVAAGAWYGTSVCVLDLALFFILSQSLSRSRDNPMHSPAEFCYAPVVLAVIVVFSTLLMSRRAQPGGVPGGKEWALRLLLLLLGVPSFFVACAYRPSREPHALNYPSGPGGWQALLCTTTLLYAAPQEGLPRRGYAAHALCLCKCLVISVGMLLCNTNWGATPPQHRAIMHDYYALRIISNDDPRLSQQSSAPLPVTMYTASAGKVFAGILVKTYCAMSACMWMSNARARLFGWASGCKVNLARHVQDLHELYIVYALACIFLALFSASRENAYTGVHVRGTYTDRQAVHSMGIVWGMLLTSLLAALVALVCSFRFIE